MRWAHATYRNTSSPKNPSRGSPQRDPKEETNDLTAKGKTFVQSGRISRSKNMTLKSENIEGDPEYHKMGISLLSIESDDVEIIGISEEEGASLLWLDEDGVGAQSFEEEDQASQSSWSSASSASSSSSSSSSSHTDIREYSSVLSPKHDIRDCSLPMSLQHEFRDCSVPMSVWSESRNNLPSCTPPENDPISTAILTLPSTTLKETFACTAGIDNDDLASAILLWNSPPSSPRSESSTTSEESSDWKASANENISIIPTPRPPPTNDFHSYSVSKMKNKSIIIAEARNEVELMYPRNNSCDDDSTTGSIDAADERSTERYAVRDTRDQEPRIRDRYAVQEEDSSIDEGNSPTHRPSRSLKNKLRAGFGKRRTMLV